MELGMTVHERAQDGILYRAKVIGYNLTSGAFLAEFVEGPYDGATKWVY